MLFPTVGYALFFGAAFVLAWGLRTKLSWHKQVLLALSWLFYALGSPRHLVLLIGVSLGATLIGQRVQRAPTPVLARRWLGFGVVLALATLVVYKYLAFFAANLLELAAHLGWRPQLAIAEIELPVGVSFFVFHAISLLVDVYRGNVKQPLTVGDGLLYVAFFPQLVAGPVVRASDFLPQLGRGPDPALLERGAGIALVIRGLFKKVVLASHLGLLLADPVFESPDDFGGLQVLLGIYAYAGQIYCDFSGYTDIAIGCARLLGYRFRDNFDSPYVSMNIQEFWRRWHISLSSFLRDYLYVPLGGSRGGRWATRRNLMITMLLGGLWHGASWTFVAWGALHGLALVVSRVWAESEWRWIQRLRQSRGWRPFAWLLTFHTVCAGWVLFRAQSTEDVGRIASRLLQAGGTVAPSALVLVAAGVLLQTLPVPVWTRSTAWLQRIHPTAQAAVAGAAVVAIDALGPIGVPPFIYFQF